MNVLTRVSRARELLGTVVVRQSNASSDVLGVLNAKDKQQRRRVYRDPTEETYRSAQRVAAQLEESDRAGEASERGEDRRGF